MSDLPQWFWDVYLAIDVALVIFAGWCLFGPIKPRRPRVGWRWTVWGWFNRSWVPNRVYYRLGDLLGITHGWRPLHMRYPEHFPRMRA